MARKLLLVRLIAALIALCATALPAAAQLPFLPPSAAAVKPGGGGASVQVFATNPGTVANANRSFSFYGTTFSVSDYPSLVMPVAGTFSTLRARAVTQPTSTNSYALSLEKNSAGTTLTCSLTSSVNPCADTTHSVAVVAGDTMNFKSTVTGAPTSTPISVAVDFVPTVANDTVLGAYGTAFSTSVTQAAAPSTDIGSGTIANRSLVNVFPDAGTLDKFYVSSNAPGAGTSYTYGIDINQVAVGSPSLFSAQISGTGTTANDTANSVSVSPTNAIVFTGTPTNTPASASTGFGLRFVSSTAKNFPINISSGITGDSTTVTNYLALGGALNATEANVQTIVNNMVITKMYAYIGSTTTLAGGTSRTFTLNVNGTGSALTCSVAAGQTACNVTATVSVNDGDLLDIADIPSNSPAAHTPAIGLVAHR